MPVVQLTTPAVEAKEYIAQAMREFPTHRSVVLNDFDRMLRGQSTPYLDRYPELRAYVLQVLRHFKTKRP